MTVQTIDTLGERIRYAREAARLTQAAVAKHFGIARVSVTQWESNTTKPDIDRIGDLADLLNTSAEWLLKRDGYPPLTTPKPTQIIPGKNLVGDKDLPVYAAAMGGDGHLIVAFEAIDYFKRPAVLEHVKGGYGIMVKGESMVPAYREGDIALVNPHLPASRDTDVVLYHTPPKEKGDAQAIIKRIAGMNDREWKLVQYNPAKIFKESRVDWPICHRVVGKYNAR